MRRELEAQLRSKALFAMDECQQSLDQMFVAFMDLRQG